MKKQNLTFVALAIIVIVAAVIFANVQLQRGLVLRPISLPPDLTIEMAFVRPSVGGRAAVSIFVKNQGGQRAPATTLQIRRDGTAIPLKAGKDNRGRTAIPVPALQPGAFHAAAATTAESLPDQTPLTAIVDPQGSIQELNENNNTQSLVWGSAIGQTQGVSAPACMIFTSWSTGNRWCCGEATSAGGGQYSYCVVM